MFPMRWFEVLFRNGHDHVVYGCEMVYRKPPRNVYFDDVDGMQRRLMLPIVPIQTWYDPQQILCCTF